MNIIFPDGSEARDICEVELDIPEGAEDCISITVGERESCRIKVEKPEGHVGAVSVMVEGSTTFTIKNPRIVTYVTGCPMLDQHTYLLLATALGIEETPDAS